MKRLRNALFCLSLAIAFVMPVPGQEEAPQRPGPGATSISELAILPVEKIGPNDLLGLTVYDSPELTREIRVDADGAIRLPMVRQSIAVAGLYPAEVENAVAGVLVKESVLVDPVVTVSVLEYRSRPITVAGAVKDPLTFQATGTMTLLDAISRAQGLSENAGSEILVSRPALDAERNSSTPVQRIPVRGLLDGLDPSLNLNLQGGEVIRVPEAGRVFVVGDVKKPGAFYLTDSSESSVLKALALSEGLDSFYSHRAYIYRVDAGGGDRKEIPIELKRIMDRKSPDVALAAGDILYIPNANGARASMKAIEETLGVGSVLGAALVYYGTR
jgi:polysaccharide export outer membrane protein